MPTGNRRFLECAVLAIFTVCAVKAEPQPVRHTRGFIHGFIALKDAQDKLLASGEVIQTQAGPRVNGVMVLHFNDGSLYQETTVFSQRRFYHLIKYTQIQKGPSFKRDETLSVDVAAGNVSIKYRDGDGREKTISEHLALPPDLANGILPTLMGDVDPKVETTLSMVVSTPKPRVVQLKIAASGEDSYSIAGITGRATHYVIKIDIGGVAGVAAKVVGKQPPPIDFWVTKDAPTFLRSEGPLYEAGPIWRIELASPTWRMAART
jgi:hypothetical protein